MEKREMHQEAEHAATERLVFFSDAVMAIALTLLAIELPLPDGITSSEMLSSVSTSRVEYIAFLVSFWVIAQHWRSHHRLFYYVDHSSPRLITVNLVWLLMVVITPFTTRLLINEGDTNLFRFTTYATVQAVQSVLFVVMVRVILRDSLLRHPEMAGALRTPVRGALALAATFAVSIPLYLLIGNVAFGVWVALPVLTGVIRRTTAWARRRGNGDEVGASAPDHGELDDGHSADREPASGL